MGQNKSNVKLIFDGYMMQLFYECVMIIYLLTGHLHMLPDHVITCVKKSLKNKNIFIPEDIVK